ncbi:MAG: hypothetical protein QM763_14100 [Agriterribacter sp.]
MRQIILINIFYNQNKNIPEYMDVFLETDIGVLKLYGTNFLLTDYNSVQSVNRADIDTLKEKYGPLIISECRHTYDSNVYLLISNSFILAIEYNLNSGFRHSVQEFRIIEDLYNKNKDELEEFRTLNIVSIPAG